MLVSGWTGALFMILYVTFLGTEGPTYQLMRRYGINVYFGATYLAQVLLVHRLAALSPAGAMKRPGWLVPGLLALAAGVLVVGSLYVAVRNGLPLEKERWENSLEWMTALFMQLSMLLVVLAWRASALHLQVGCGQSR